MKCPNCGQTLVLGAVQPLVTQRASAVEGGDEPELYEELGDDSNLVERTRNLVRWPAIALLVVGLLGLILDLFVAGFGFVDDFITPLTESSLIGSKERKAKQGEAAKTEQRGPGFPPKGWKAKKGVIAKPEAETKNTRDPSKEGEEQSLETSVFTIALLLSLAAASALAVAAGFCMLKLRMYWLAVVGSFAIMPGGGFCCLMGLPVGIWSLVVLFKPEVRSTFS